MSTDPAGAVALFVPEGGAFVPTDLARGPWTRDALHGGPPSALLARAVEHHAGDDGLQLVRLTVELVRPVPVAPLEVSCTVIRPGRRVQLVDAVLRAAGTDVALARGLRIRVAPPADAVEPTVPEDEAPPGPASGTILRPVRDAYTAFHNSAMEIRFVRGTFDGPGPATAWFRLRHPVVAGEAPSPWQRVAAAADFGNGISAELVWTQGTVFINPDLTVDVHRPPVGEWVCLDARTRFGTPGIGTAESALWDERGRIGRSVQNLVVEPGG